MAEYTIKLHGLCPEQIGKALEMPQAVSYILQLGIGRDRMGKTGDMTLELHILSQWLAEVELQQELIKGILDRKLVVDVDKDTVTVFDAKPTKRK